MNSNSQNIEQQFRRKASVVKNFFDCGDLKSYKNGLAELSNLLSEVMLSGNVDLALNLEVLWYGLVKLQESELNYFDAFKNHALIFYKYASLTPVKTSLSLLTPNSDSNPNNDFCFVLQNPVLLGHTEVMFSVISNLKRKNPNLRIIVAALIKTNDIQFKEKIEETKIEYWEPDTPLSPHLAALWLRDKVLADKCNRYIWVSVPCWVSYIFGLIKNKKLYLWSLKFHPFYLGSNICHIAMSKKNHGTVLINGHPWIAFKPPLTTIAGRYSIEEIIQLKAIFAGKFLFGTLAREEKYNSDIFLSSLVEIVKACPNAIYLCTGRNVPTKLMEKFEQARLLDRVVFIGWVNTDTISASLDVFLESFPFGCGVTGVQSLLNGAKLVSMWDDDTLPRFYFDDVGQANNFSKSWFVASSVDEYINMAINSYKAGEYSKFCDIKLGNIDDQRCHRFLEILNSD